MDLDELEGKAYSWRFPVLSVGVGLSALTIGVGSAAGDQDLRESDNAKHDGACPNEVLGAERLRLLEALHDDFRRRARSPRLPTTTAPPMRRVLLPMLVTTSSALCLRCVAEDSTASAARSHF